VALNINPADSIKSLGKDILAGFLAKLPSLKPSPEELAIAQRAAERLATCAVLMPGAPADVQKALATRRDLALAALANIGVVKAIQAERVMRQTAQEVIVKALQVAFAIAIAA